MRRFIALVVYEHGDCLRLYVRTSSASKVLAALDNNGEINSVTVYRITTYEILSRVKKFEVIAGSGDCFAQTSHPKYLEEDYL